MNVLLVEDDVHKADRISTFLYSSFENLKLSYAKSVQEGIDEISISLIDLILLDMSLPIFAYTYREQGFKHSSYAGEDILEHLDNFDIDIPVIVITAFNRFGEEKNALTLEQLDNKLRKNYPTQYIGSVWYNSLEDEWQNKLLDFINTVNS